MLVADDQTVLCGLPRLEGYLQRLHNRASPRAKAIASVIVGDGPDKFRKMIWETGLIMLLMDSVDDPDMSWADYPTVEKT